MPVKCCSCESCSTWFRTPARIIMGLIEVGLAIAIINIIYWHLTNFDTNLENGQVVNYQCLLGTTESNDDLCVYGYIVCGIAIGAACYLILSVLFRCLCWQYVDFVLDFIVTVLAAIVWFVAAAVITDYNNNKVQQETDVQKSWRNSVTTMAWVMFALFTLDAIGSTFRFLYKACGCCGGYEAKKLVEVKEELKKKDEEIGELKAQLEAYTKPPQPQAMAVVPDPANPGGVAVAIAGTPSTGPEVSAPSAAKPEASNPSKPAVYPPVPPAGGAHA